MDNEFAAAMAGWGPIILMLVIFYFLLYRPQKKAQKEREEMLNSLKVGSRILTIGGIYGTITGIDDEIIKLQIADKVEIEVAKSSVNNNVSDKPAEN